MSKPTTAEVTREHRMWAIACIEEWEYGLLTPDHEAWLAGEPTEGEYDWEDSMARSIAEAELRGKLAALNELDAEAQVNGAQDTGDNYLESIARLRAKYAKGAE